MLVCSMWKGYWLHIRGVKKISLKFIQIGNGMGNSDACNNLQLSPSLSLSLLDIFRQYVMITIVIIFLVCSKLFEDILNKE